MKLKPRMVPPQVALEHGSSSGFDGPNCGSYKSDDKYGSYGSGGQLSCYSCGYNCSRNDFGFGVGDMDDALSASEDLVVAGGNWSHNDISTSADATQSVFSIDGGCNDSGCNNYGSGDCDSAQSIVCLPYLPCGSSVVDQELWWDCDDVDVSAHMAEPYHNYTYLNGFTTLGESGYYCLDCDKDLFATGYTGSLCDLFTRVSSLFDDLWTGGPGGIYAEGAAGTGDEEARFVATWWGGQHYHDYHGASYFQASNVFVCFVVYSAHWHSAV